MLLKATEELKEDYIQENQHFFPVRHGEGLIYICGGYVRDKLLGMESKDIDMIVDKNIDIEKFKEKIKLLCSLNDMIRFEERDNETLKVRTMTRGVCKDNR